ncbi:MAG: LacI family DNA-binding transcriptional regulator [Planctomycetota bacterium]|jgi:DNA-binding LacI/PurR family transcriptional regulator|nr:LacI family DNA-binding transcriptional regulator [Planctomycetota bacterium]
MTSLSRRPAALTQAEIARLCAVSQATVSLVLRDPETARVSASTRDRILQAVADRPIRPVQRRRGRRIGLLANFGTHPGIAGYAERLVAGVQERAASYKRNVVVDSLASGRPLFDHQFVASCAGLVVCHLRITEDQVAKVLDAGVPVVLLECDAGTERCDVVRVDNCGSVVLAVRHLAEQGHRRIAWYGQRPDGNSWPHGRAHFERLAAFRTACAAFGLDEDPDLIGIVDHEAGPSDATRRLLERWRSLPEPPTAVACYNDLHALTVQREAQSLGWEVPAQLSIIGIDAIAPGALSVPALTTVDPCLEQLGRAAIDQVMLRLENDEAAMPTIIHCHPRLVPRASVAAPTVEKDMP